MMKTRTMIGLAISFLIVGAAVWVRGPELKKKHEGETVSATELAQMRADLQSLTDSVRRSERMALSAVQVSAMAQASASAPPSRAETDNGVKPEAPRQSADGITAQEMGARLNNIFENEIADSSWSKPATTLIEQHIRQGFLDGSRLLSVACRRTVCRVESEHANEAIYQRFLNDALLFPHGGWDGPVMTQILNPGEEPVKLVAYFLRPGEDLERIATQGLTSP